MRSDDEGNGLWSSVPLDSNWLPSAPSSLLKADNCSVFWGMTHTATHTHASTAILLLRGYGGLGFH